MQSYFHHGDGESGVTAFETREDSIVLEFREGARYLYNNQRPGLQHVAAMKTLARSGRGLATYLNKFVRDRYAKKLR